MPNFDIISLTIDQDWTYRDLEPGCILRYLEKSYDKDKQRTIYFFDIIGKPVDKDKQPIIEIIPT